MICTTDDEEQKVPWVGRVTKRTMTMVYFDWLIRTANGFWKSGIIPSKGDTVFLSKIIAKFQFDTSKPMESDLYASLV